MKRLIKNAPAIILLIFIASCNNSTENTDSATPADSLSTVANEDTTANQVLFNIPSPMETFMILKMANVPFDKSLLNPSANVTKYVTNFSKSINLGTYSADLAFCLLYQQNQEIETYLKNTGDLKNSLNIDGAFFQSVIKRVKSNSNNLDSMMQIVSEANVNTNMYLNENKMDNTIALISAGGWAEGLYMLSSIAEKTKNKEVTGMLEDIKGISTLYESLKSTQGTAKASTDKNIASIGNNTSLELTNEQLKLVVEKATALRNKLIN